jgi:RNA polymerase sigma-70 factor (ECF subfamily)
VTAATAAGFAPTTNGGAVGFQLSDETVRDTPRSNAEWLEGLASSGRRRESTIRDLRALLVKAARHHLHRMSAASSLGALRFDEIVESAADEATVSVLARVETFEGRSLFTTWAFKFGILHANVEYRRASWSEREIPLDDGFDLASADDGPDEHAELTELRLAVHEGLQNALTHYQRTVAVALLIDEVPIDVLAERLGTSRGALYKNLHEARKRLRIYLAERDMINPRLRKEA